jgi:hypothetical protein
MARDNTLTEMKMDATVQAQLGAVEWFVDDAARLDDDHMP